MSQEKMRTNTETTLSAKELLLQAQKFNLRSNEDIFDKESWVFMFLLPKTEEDIGVLNKLFYACRSNILPPPFSNDNIDNLIAMEYYLTDGGIDWTCFYNLNGIIKYNTQDKFKIVPNV